MLVFINKYTELIYNILKKQKSQNENEIIEIRKDEEENENNIEDKK